jgi:hypothetical protein
MHRNRIVRGLTGAVIGTVLFVACYNRILDWAEGQKGVG